MPVEQISWLPSNVKTKRHLPVVLLDAVLVIITLVYFMGVVYFFVSHMIGDNAILVLIALIIMMSFWIFIYFKCFSIQLLFDPPLWER